MKIPSPTEQEQARKVLNISPNEWSGSPDPCDPDNYWIDDVTNERVSLTGERSNHDCPFLDDEGTVVEEYHA